MICPDGQLIAVYALAATTSAPAKTFVYGSYVDEPLMQVSGQEKLYFSRNQQYSITGATNAAGQIVERYAYTAYGETIILSPAGTPRVTSSVGNPFTYTGRYNHAEVGLMYFRARYYDSATGEFISRDPLEYVDGMSLYSGYFVPGAVDPSGTDLCPISVGGFGTVWVQCPEAPDNSQVVCGACNRGVGANVLLQLAANGIDGSDDEGGGNAMRHCVASCQSSKACGQNCAQDFWNGREDPNTPAGAQDLANNAVGFGNSSEDSCWDSCLDDWDNSRLMCNGRPCPPRPTRCPIQVRPNGGFGPPLG